MAWTARDRATRLGAAHDHRRLDGTNRAVVHQLALGGTRTAQDSDDPEIQAIAREIAAQAGVGPEEALRIARQRRGDIARRKAEALEWLRAEVWPKIPSEHRGKTMTKEEREEILDYGPHRV